MAARPVSAGRRPDPRRMHYQQHIQSSRLDFFGLLLFFPSCRCFNLHPSSVFFLSLSENADINVTCGTQYMDLSIYICPIYNAQYNESQMVLNNQFKNPLCFGKADWSVTPPVLRFRFPINETSLSDCDNNFQVFNSLHLPRLFESSTFLVNWSRGKGFNPPAWFRKLTV